MEFKDIQKLMAEFEKSSTRELKIDDQDFHLYLSKNNQSANTADTPAQREATTDGEGDSQAVAAAEHATIKAPLVGTVYLQPKPHQPAYVQPGDQVHKGDVVCVIEAMKMLTEVKSDYDGQVVAVNVENGDLVEVDQPLFEIKEG